MDFNIRREIENNFPNSISPWLNSVHNNSKLKDGDEYWACAYETDNTEKSMSFKQEPIFGIIKEENKTLVFYPYGKSKKPLKSKRVLISGRIFSKTNEESKSIYNYLVNKQIKLFEELLIKTKSDLI